MEITLYQVDAFAGNVFEGNPAAVCPLDAWLPDEVLQSIAMENNLSETAYFVSTASGYHIRWFTPTHEVDLCGHATLASAYVIFTVLGYAGPVIEFDSRSGMLSVTRNGEWFEMDFPAQPAVRCDPPGKIIEAFGLVPVDCLSAADYILVFDEERNILDANPDLALLAGLDLRGVAITARSGQYDFVTRFFAPKYGINEDPVTGSAFTQLVPYWADRLDKNSLVARQVSRRGGVVKGTLSGDRVSISGQAVLFLTGTIKI